MSTSAARAVLEARSRLDCAISERDRARLTAATLANRLFQAERLLLLTIQPGTSHAQDEETGRLINDFLANGGNHHD